MTRALLAEWTKFRTLRSTYWTLIASAVLTVALGSVILRTSFLDRYDRMSAAERSDVDPAGIGIWYHGLHLGQIMIAVLGVLLATGEYGSGTIRATLAAIPNRRRVFAAKALGFGGLALAVNAVIAFTTFAVARPALASHGLDVSLTDATALRGVAMAALAGAGTALLGLGAGVLIRHTAGAVTTLLVIMLGLPIIGQFLPESWQRIARYLPPEPGWAMFTPSDTSLALGVTTAVFAAWVAAVLVAAAATFHRRDA